MHPWSNDDDATIDLGQPDMFMSFPQIISAYFRHPARIVKPSSRHQSPRNGRRSRTTTTIPTRTRSVAESSRITNQQTTVARSRPTRPISWHPNSLQNVSQPSVSNDSQFLYQLTHLEPIRTTYAHGLVTPSCGPVVDDSQVHDLIPTLDALATYPEMDRDPFVQSYTPVMNWQSSKLDPDEQLPYTADLSATYPWPSNIATTYDITTAPSSPAFFPFPDLGDSLFTDEGDVGDGEELVGMGLYDSPAEVQSSFLFGGGISRPRKKSLKLEESFEPEPPEEEEKEECNKDVDISYTDLLIPDTNTASLSLSNPSQAQSSWEWMVATNAKSYIAHAPMPVRQFPIQHNMTGWI